MDSGLVKKAKDLLGHHAFGNDPVKGVSQDYNKPLFVPAYSDAFQTIMGQEAAGGGGRISLDMWKHQYTTHFPQTVNMKFFYSSHICPESNLVNIDIPSIPNTDLQSPSVAESNGTMGGPQIKNVPVFVY